MGIEVRVGYTGNVTTALISSDSNIEHFFVLKALPCFFHAMVTILCFIYVFALEGSMQSEAGNTSFGGISLPCLISGTWV